jgi:hypothetical protein
MPIQQECTQAAPKKQHIVETSAVTLNKSKKRKGFFFSFKFKTTSLRPRYIGRMSASAIRPWGTWEGTNKGVDHAKRIERRNLRG